MPVASWNAPINSPTPNHNACDSHDESRVEAPKATGTWAPRPRNPVAHRVCPASKNYLLRLLACSLGIASRTGMGITSESCARVVEQEESYGGAW